LFQIPLRERAGDVLLAQQRTGRPRSAADGCDRLAPMGWRSTFCIGYSTPWRALFWIRPRSRQC